MTNQIERSEQLAHLSKEIERLIERIDKDVRDQREVKGEGSISGFVIYLLRKADKSLIESPDLRKTGIGIAEISKTHGFTRLKDYCDRLSLKARLEDTIRPSRDVANPCLGIIVDGWP